MGAGSVSEVGKQSKILGGTKALVVTDKPLIAAGIAEKVTKLMENKGIICN
jgi:alcohol dehydrogenase